MKRCLIIITFAVIFLIGQVFYMPGFEYLIGADDDTIELHSITPVIYQI